MALNNTVWNWAGIIQTTIFITYTQCLYYIPMYIAILLSEQHSEKKKQNVSIIVFRGL